MAGSPPDSVVVPLGDPTGGQGGPTASIAVADCTRCHGTPGLDSTNADPLVAAAPPNAIRFASSPGAGVHRAHLQDGPYRKAVECASCHLVPTNANHPTQAMLGKVTFSRLATTSSSGTPLSPTWNGTTCAGTYCHGNFRNGKTAATPSWTAPGSIACGSCHAVSATNGPGGTHPTLATGQTCATCHGAGYSLTSVDLSLHINGVVDGGESQGGGNCGDCHSTIFAAMNGTATHASKHTLGNVSGTNDSPTDTGIAWASPLSTNAAAARSCVNMCHSDHPHDLTNPAVSTHQNNVYLDASTQTSRGGTTRTSATRSATDFDGTQASGGLCISCHQAPIVTAGPTIGAVAFGASAHDYSTNTVGANTYTWGYALHDGSTFVRDCTKCHSSRTEGTTPAAQVNHSSAVAVHYSDDASLLAGTTNPAGTPAGFVCYNCHGSAAAPAAGAQGDRSGKNIQSQVVHATTTGQSGHPADSDLVHDSAAEFAGASFGNALGVPAGTGQRHSNCLDCHEQHQAKAGTHAQGTSVAGPPLQGAWGARWTGTLAAWGTPTSANLVKATIQAGTELEATLCFKCHSSYYWGTGTAPTSPSGGFAETDTAREFNPANTGFHPVLATNSGTLGNTGNVSSPWTRTSLMTCSDCHESDVTTDPNGPHGSAAKFILKGPNTTWSASVTSASATAWMPTGTFCLNCHANDATTSRYTGHSIGNHAVPCMTCHAAIPHGGPRPGMLVDSVGTSGACVPQGGVIADWDTAGPYSAATTTTLCIKSYPASNTTGWTIANCGCSGSGH